MNTLRNVLASLAFVFAIGAAYATIQQQAYFKHPITGQGTLGTISTPVDTDVQPCLVQPGTQCKIKFQGLDFDAYDTPANAAAEGSIGLLKYVP